MPNFKVLIQETTTWYGVVEAKDVEDAKRKCELELFANGADAFHQDEMSEGYRLVEVVPTDEKADVVIEED